MVEQPVSTLQPGMILATDISTGAAAGQGYVLLPAATTLTERHIRMLKAHGILYVSIEDHGAAARQLQNDLMAAHYATQKTHDSDITLLEMFRYTDANHPFIRELIRICQVRASPLPSPHGAERA